MCVYVMTGVCQVDFSIHDSIAVFTAVLIARHCFTLEDLVRVVALQSLLAACPSGNHVHMFQTTALSICTNLLVSNIAVIITLPVISCIVCVLIYLFCSR